MKYAVVYILDYSYTKYLNSSLSSLLLNNSNITFDIIFFYESERTLKELQAITKKYNKNFIYKSIIKENYLETVSTYNDYYRLEIFTLEEYDKILYLDCDTIICKDISELFYNSLNFGAVKYIYNTDYYYSLFKLKNYFNAGVLVVGKKYLNQATYSGLLRKLSLEKNIFNQTRAHEGNEPFFNSAFNSIFTPLPAIFNSTIYTANYEDIKKSAIIHFQGISKFFYNLKSLVNYNKNEEYLLFVKQLNIDIDFNLITRIFLKTKRYIKTNDLYNDSI